MQWREAYDNLLRENESLRGKGMEAAVAKEWRVRYEKELREKEEVKERLVILEGKLRGGGGGRKREGGEGGREVRKIERRGGFRRHFKAKTPADPSSLFRPSFRPLSRSHHFALSRRS